MPRLQQRVAELDPCPYPHCPGAGLAGIPQQVENDPAQGAVVGLDGRNTGVVVPLDPHRLAEFDRQQFKGLVEQGVQVGFSLVELGLAEFPDQLVDAVGFTHDQPRQRLEFARLEFIGQHLRRPPNPAQRVPDFVAQVATEQFQHAGLDFPLLQAQAHTLPFQVVELEQYFTPVAAFHRAVVKAFRQVQFVQPQGVASRRRLGNGSQDFRGYVGEFLRVPAHGAVAADHEAVFGRAVQGQHPPGGIELDDGGIEQVERRLGLIHGRYQRFVRFIGWYGGRSEVGRVLLDEKGHRVRCCDAPVSGVTQHRVHLVFAAIQLQREAAAGRCFLGLAVDVEDDPHAVLQRLRRPPADRHLVGRAPEGFLVLRLRDAEIAVHAAQVAFGGLRAGRVGRSGRGRSILHRPERPPGTAHRTGRKPVRHPLPRGGHPG